MTRQFLHRPIRIAAVVAFFLLLVSAAFVVTASFRSLHRLESLRVHMSRLSELENLVVDIELLDDSHADELALRARKLRAEDGFFISTTTGQLGAVADALEHGANVERALSILRKTQTDETRAHDELLQSVSATSRDEARTSIAVAIAIPLLALLALVYLRRRILGPLRDLGTLLNQLAEQNYERVVVTDAAPALQNLLNSYNELVERLDALEAANVARRQSLEEAVHSATEALLAQQSSLARAERLAAVGVMAAGLAHELRNPLAGVQMALTNLRTELGHGELAERIDLITEEVKRVVRSLNDVLSQSKHTPETVRRVQLHDLVEELLALVRFQLPGSVRLENDVSPDLTVKVPENGLRQALLNLVMNSAQALSDRSGVVRVSARCSESLLQLSVVDSGPGFSEELLVQRGRAFVSQKDSGTGLGLAMVNGFARNLGGELRLANETSGGACATIEFSCED